MILCVGCTDINLFKSQKNETKEVVKVLYESEEAFFTNYGSLLSAKYPNIEFVVIPFPYVAPSADGEEIQLAYDQVIKEQQPDVLFLFPEQVERYGNLGQLYNLDSLINQDRFDIEKLHPAIVDYIRSIGSGQLFALTPNFYGTGVYYNKDLFDKFQVPYPTDAMTWEELMQLARRFSPSSTSSYGIRFNSANSSLFQLALKIGANNDLKYIDLEHKRMTLNTPSWKNIFQSVFDTYKEDAIYQNSDQDKLKPGMTYQERLLLNPFITNQVAMAIEGHYFMNDLRLAEELKPEEVPNWDVVSLPSNDDQLFSEDSIWIQYMLSINSQSANLSAAWEVVKYINSEEFTRVTLKSTLRDSLPLRRSAMTGDSHNLDAFYKPKMNPYQPQSNLRLSHRFNELLNAYADTEIEKAYEGSITLDEALSSIEQKGQELLLDKNMSNAQ